MPIYKRMDRYLTKKIFDAAGVVNKYYKVCRWEYYNKVIEIIKEQFSDSKLVCELGPNRLPIINNSHTIEIESETCPTYLMDATITPWPISDKQYDLFIALQVIEHLTGAQQRVFGEIRRTSKSAIISLPYKWDCEGDCHHNIDETTIQTWTGCEPNETYFVGSRVIMVYRF